MRTAIAILVTIMLVFSLGNAQFCDPPGEPVGTTQYPVQSSGMAANRIGSDPAQGVHFTWMKGTSIFDRNVYYNFRDLQGQWLGETLANQANGAGYPTMALTPVSAAAIAYHNSGNGYVRLAVDAVPGFGVFDYYDPPDLAPSGNHAIWPQVAVSSNGDIHILMVEHTQDPGVYPSMMYTRSEDGGRNWTSPEVVAEVALLNGCITASQDGQVAIVFLNPVTQGEFSQVKNDVCYFVSEDGRTWDFSNPINITDYGNDELEIYCPWGIDAVLDIDGDLNITWVTGHIDDNGNFIDEITQLWHYSALTEEITLITETTDPSLTCIYGAVTLPISLPSISIGAYPQLEVIYVGYDDSDASSEGDCVGDLYMAYGYADGRQWEGPFNITETHSPDCSPGDCLSENFPSAAETMPDSVQLVYVLQKLGDSADTVYYMPVLGQIGDAVHDNRLNPRAFRLIGNHPNPFNTRTVVEFQLSEQSKIRLTIYDITGGLLETLYDGRLGAGAHSISWIADSYASGVYYYRLSTDSESQVKKMVLLK